MMMVMLNFFVVINDDGVIVGVFLVVAKYT